MPDEDNEDVNPEQSSAGLASGFLGDLTDGRPKGDWDSRYDEDARKHIKWEKKYLLILFFICLLLPLIVGIASNEWLVENPAKFQNLKKYLFALFGGTLGGTLFAMKWLVHSVAKDTWNYDRQLWRVFTPLLSGGLAFVIIILINCQMFRIK